MWKTYKEKNASANDIKLRKYAMGRANGLNMTNAAIEAGYSVGAAYKAGSRIEPYAKKSIKEALEAQGVSNEKLAAVVMAGLEATKLAGKDDSVVVDYSERRQYTRLALEAKEELKGNVTAVQINFPAGLAEFLGEKKE